MQANDRRLVKLVEVESVAQDAREPAQPFWQWIPSGFGVQRSCRGNAGGDSHQTRAGGKRSVNEGRKQLLREIGRAPGSLGGKLPVVDAFDADEAADQAEHGKNTQRPDHDRRRFLRAFGRTRFRRAVKHDKDQAKHVERRQKSHEHRKPEERIPLHGVVRLQRLGQDAVLAEKPGKRP